MPENRLITCKRNRTKRLGSSQVQMMLMVFAFMVIGLFAIAVLFRVLNLSLPQFVKALTLPMKLLAGAKGIIG